MKFQRLLPLASTTAAIGFCQSPLKAETVLLTDNFDSETSFTANPNADQSGMLAPASYTVGDPWGGGFQRRGTGVLELGYNGTSNGSSRVLTSANYILVANAFNSPIRISFDLNATEADWVGFMIGTSATWMDSGAYGPTEFSALFRQDGSGNKWVNGFNQNATTTDTSGSITIELRNTAGTGSAFNGTGSVLQVWRGTTDLGTYTLDQLSSNNGNFALASWNPSGAGGTVDNFKIAATVDSMPNRWSGGVDGNWDETTGNFTGGSFSAIKSNGATSAMFGDVNGTLGPVTNSSITIADAGVEIADVLFDNNNVAYSLASGGATGITGASNLVKTGAGTLTISNANTYSGTTTVSAGELILSGGANRLPATTAMTLGSPAVLRLNGNDQTLATLSSNGRVVNGNATLATLTIDSSSDSTFSGSLGGTGTDENHLALVKSGSGTLRLTSPNSFTGGTTVQGGSVVLAYEPAEISNTALGPMASANIVTINDGATLTGSGGNNWLSNTAVSSGGANAIAVVINPGGKLQGASGLVTGLGNVALNGGTIEVSSGLGAWGWFASFTLGGDITVSGSTPSSITTSPGANANAAMYLANGANGSGGTRTFTVNDVSGDAASDLVISARIAKGTVVKQGSGTVEIAAGETGTETPASWQIADGRWVLASAASYTCVVTNTASNSISEYSGGNGTADINGILKIDTSAVTLTSGNTWTLIDVPNLGASFDPTSFNIPGFTQQPDGLTWKKSDSTGNWSFSETTGVLTLSTGSDYETWGSQFGLAAGSESGDADGDGLTNFQEYAFGLLPNNPASVNPITTALKPDGTFTYARRATPAVTGLTYKILVSTDLTNWSEDTTAATGTITTDNGVESVPVTVSSSWLANSKLFVRVSVTKP